MPPSHLHAKTFKWKQSGRNFFKELSSSMAELYLHEYAVSDKVWKRREMVRASVERVVSTSGEFPPGTKVAVFGSSANGFGYVSCLTLDLINTLIPQPQFSAPFSSPNSDLDLCLQVPRNANTFTK